MQGKLSSYVFYVLAAIALAVGALYIVGGSTEVSYNNEFYDAPNNTDALLYLIYAFVIIACIATLIAAVLTFVAKLKSGGSENKRSAFTSVAVTAILAILFAVTYAIGDDTPLNLIGYEGSENQGGYLKMADMCLYSIYVLIFVAAVSAILNPVVKKILK